LEILTSNKDLHNHYTLLPDTPESILHFLTQKKTEQCVQRLTSVFQLLQAQRPWKSTYNIYANPQWREALFQYLQWSPQHPATLLDNHLKPALEKIWLTFSRPSYDYFLDPAYTSGVRFDLRRL